MNEKSLTEAEYTSEPDCVPVDVVLNGPVTNSDAAGCRSTCDWWLSPAQHFSTTAELWTNLWAQPPDLLPAVLLYLWSVSGQRLVRNRWWVFQGREQEAIIYKLLCQKKTSSDGRSQTCCLYKNKMSGEESRRSRKFPRHFIDHEAVHCYICEAWSLSESIQIYLYLFAMCSVYYTTVWLLCSYYGISQL